MAEYVLSNYNDVAFMTASQLAEQVGFDTTAVVRFAQRLGFVGWPDFQASVVQHVKDEMTLNGYGHGYLVDVIRSWHEYHEAMANGIDMSDPFQVKQASELYSRALYGSRKVLGIDV